MCPNNSHKKIDKEILLRIMMVELDSEELINDPDEEDYEERPKNCCGRGCCGWGQKYG